MNLFGCGRAMAGGETKLKIHPSTSPQWGFDSYPKDRYIASHTRADDQYIFKDIPFVKGK